MMTTLVTVGIACLLTAIVGGKLKAFGIEMPALKSPRRQMMLGALGACLVIGGLLIGGAIPLPSRGGGDAGAQASGGAQGSSTPASGGSSAGAAAAPAASCSTGTALWSDLDAGRIVEVESGADATLLRADQSKSTAAAFVVTDGGKRAGAVRYRFYSANSLFKIEQIVDAECRPATTYRIVDREDRNVLQNWDTLEVQLGQRTFSARLGYNAGIVSLRLTRIVK